MAVTEGQLISDGTAVWKVKKIGNGELPAGTTQMFAGNTIPEGWLLCDGSAVSRTDYAKLFSVIGTTYGEGDGSTTFALPLLTDGRFIEGSDVAGTQYAAGLPNITGSMTRNLSENEEVSTGALSQEGTKAGYLAFGDSCWLATLQFDASKSNSIYGSSTTVQPPALTMLPIIKY